ncbi:MAG: hypothetical protein IPH12_02295 [Saprospirales bacterium]|nr:hypothetical protein [Saprospirales bacterium]MBK8921523.1 hypothetical protein [Saprospirales bacterium]
METLYNLLDPYIDFHRYPPVQLVFLGFGFIFWVLAYKEILQGIRKYQLVEIPMIVVALDISWEFSWAFLLKNDLGLLFSFGCAIWFFLDIFINYNTLRYGYKLVTNSWIKKMYGWIYLFVLIGGLSITYFMREKAADNGLGVISAYFINLMISSLYIYQLLTSPQLRNRGFSYRVAWTKFLGTGSITVVCFMHWAHNWYLLTMCLMVAVMDITYIWLFKYYQPEALADNAKAAAG